jgi:hypothetical protein
VVVERLLQRQYEEMGGKYPESIAVVLWGTDNIKTYGESLGQVMPGPSWAAVLQYCRASWFPERCFQPTASSPFTN